jgi:hypothetical protein
VNSRKQVMAEIVIVERRLLQHRAALQEHRQHLVAWLRSNALMLLAITASIFIASWRIGTLPHLLRGVKKAGKMLFSTVVTPVRYLKYLV